MLGLLSESRNMPKLNLRTSADVALILASIVVVLYATNLYYARAARTPPEPRVVEVKERVEIPSIDFTSNSQTLLLVLSSKCPYCTKSMSFYSRLAMGAQHRTKLVAVGSESSSVLTEYLTQHDVDLDNIVSIRGDRSPSEITPTLILVGRDGVVKHVWRGQQSPEMEEEILRLVSS